MRLLKTVNVKCIIIILYYILYYILALDVEGWVIKCPHSQYSKYRPYGHAFFNLCLFILFDKIQFVCLFKMFLLHVLNRLEKTAQSPTPCHIHAGYLWTWSRRL